MAKDKGYEVVLQRSVHGGNRASKARQWLREYVISFIDAHFLILML